MRSGVRIAIGSPFFGYCSDPVIESIANIIVSLPLFITGLFFFYLKPRGLAENLQQHFESELIKALSQNWERDGKTKNESLNLPESTKEKTS